jgi:hypothetical protein
MDLTEIYDGAADLIDERGWRQGGRMDLTGPVCITESIGQLAPERQAAYDFLAFKVLRLGARSNQVTSGERLVSWNDHPSRSKEHVIAALRKAAKQYHQENA